MIEFKNLPVEIQQRMLDEQVRQGNKRDAEVFVECMYSAKSQGGFTWAQSVEDTGFWTEILLKGNFVVFFEKYPKRPLKVITLHIKIIDSNELL